MVHLPHKLCSHNTTLASAKKNLYTHIYILKWRLEGRRTIRRKFSPRRILKGLKIR